LPLALLATLAGAAVVSTLARRVRVSEIPAYLIAGVLVGPHALGLVRDPADVEQISSLAIVMLMFTLGLSLDTASVGRGIVHVLGIGVVSTFASAVVGVVLSLGAGATWPASVAIGLAVALSSTAVFVRVVQTRRELRTTHARVGLGVSIVQDLVAVGVLAVIPVLSMWAGHGAGGTTAESWGLLRGLEGLPGWAQVWARSSVGLGGMAAIVLIGRWVLPRLLREVAKVGSGELLLVSAAAMALAFAIGTSMLGFSPEMGAFLAGFMLASTPFRYQLTGQLAPVRDLLMALFFTTVGLGVDPGVISGSWWVVVVGVVAIVMLKGTIIAGTCWLGGMSAPEALLAGVYLANAGEFTLVAMSAAVAGGVVDASVYGQVVLMVTGSLLVTPTLVGPAHRWGGRLAWVPLAGIVKRGAIGDHGEGHGPEGAEGEGHRVDGMFDSARHVIVAGYGPVGRALVDRLDKIGVTTTIVELNPRTVAKQSLVGRKIVYGDISNPEVLEQAGLARAQAVCLTIPDDDAVMRACAAIREQSASVFIAARTSYLSQGIRARQLGADHVTVEEVAAAYAMEREVVAKLQSRKGGDEPSLATGAGSG
jgi:CPA2 family monovalent cation:H+ antiporter-2